VSARELDRSLYEVGDPADRAILSVAETRDAVHELANDRDAWKARARKAERELEEACDTIYELQQMLNRAHTGAA
jgi:chromosome segregation ATPase